MTDQAELAAALRKCAGRGAAEIAAQVQQAVLDGGDRQPRDDITVLVLRMPVG